MVLLKKMTYGSTEYQESLELRDRVMRKPLGLSIFDEDFSKEKDAVIYAAYDKELLLGVGVLSIDTGNFRVDYLCVDPNLQGKGVGKALLTKLEDIALMQEAASVTLEARVSAVEFYKKQGYQTVGERYIMETAPVGHIKMEKRLIK